MRLSDFSVGTKIISLVVLISAGAALVGITGYTGLDTLLLHLGRVASDGDQAVLGARMNQNLIILNRSEYRIASDPSPDSIKAAEEVVRPVKDVFEKSFKELKVA